MKRLIATILIMSLLLIAGCAKESPMSSEPLSKVSETKVTITEPAAPGTAASTQDEVTSVETELDSIDSLDEDFNTAELDQLDKDLDFEI